MWQWGYLICSQAIWTINHGEVLCKYSQRRTSMIKLAFCGNDCDFCLRYIATKSGSESELKRVAKLWFNCGWRDKLVPSNEMICRGCSSANWCRYGIRECAIEKKVENCGKYRGYPCDKIQKAFDNIKIYSKKCRIVCSKEDFKLMEKASFHKKKNLDRV